SRAWLAVAMSAMSCWSSTGIRGRSRRRDFHRQNKRNDCRCYRTKVSGCTIVSRSRHATNPGQQEERDAGRVVRAPRPDVAFEIAHELLPEEEILGGQSRPRLECQR